MSRGIYGRILYWRATMQPARMLLWDARLAPVVGLALLHARLWTLTLLAVALAAAFWIESRGMTVPAAMRGLRSALAGQRRWATRRRPRRPACYSEECAGGWRWDPALLKPVPPPLWQRRADRRTARLAAAAASQTGQGKAGTGETGTHG